MQGPDENLHVECTGEVLTCSVHGQPHESNIGTEERVKGKINSMESFEKRVLKNRCLDFTLVRGGRINTCPVNLKASTSLSRV